MANITLNIPGASGFLYSGGRGAARLCITAETPDFDTETLRSWRNEGFDVVYVPADCNEKEYISRLRSVKEGLGVGENYAVLAFGDAASFCLDYYLKPMHASRLCALIAYYPTSIPDTRSHYSPMLPVMTHLAGDSVDVITAPVVLGLQGKKKRITRRIDPGIGVGERLNIGHKAYTYDYAQPGFAEQDLEEYDRLASDLAFSRTLEMLRKGFGREVDLEEVLEEHLEAKFFSMNLSDTMDPYVNHLTPAVTYTPTLSGGIGRQALRRFYDQSFLRQLPPTMRLRLVSRTIGADRVVDELYVSFDHTHEIPWMVPGIAPTNKHVEIMLVSIVALRAGKLYSEHTYWDQASVLVQLGLLDPKLAPQQQQTAGADRLPVIGRESARRVLLEDSEKEGKDYHNRLIRRARAKGKDKEAATPSVDEFATEILGGEAKGKGKTVRKEGTRGDDLKGENGNGEEAQAAKGSATVEDADDN
ncbi:hypothetical protein FE257_002669 [Aspergillus nanangensis]|uniref:Dienelactone hydrolase n=1 Tax=Aspergillus nanangensis TaxID=2582783 RepID=A0AAD4CCI9_ASPNN|nr:hypothetical protein FE257_002669 [Aspergillus nanangensis]